MTSINDPIRQASLFTTWGLVDPRLMPTPSENAKEKIKKLAPSSWWMRLTDFLFSGNKPANA